MNLTSSLKTDPQAHTRQGKTIWCICILAYPNAVQKEVNKQRRTFEQSKAAWSRHKNLWRKVTKYVTLFVWLMIMVHLLTTFSWTFTFLFFSFSWICCIQQTFRMRITSSQDFPTTPLSCLCLLKTWEIWFTLISCNLNLLNKYIVSQKKVINWITIILLLKKHIKIRPRI